VRAARRSEGFPAAGRGAAAPAPRGARPPRRRARGLVREDVVSAAETATVVVPCFNEAERLDADAFRKLVDSDPGTSLLFVNDGSRDGTAAALQTLAASRPDRIRVLELGRNRGKAEAVRLGLLAALAGRSDVVGFVDADLATPASEIQRLLELVRGGDLQVLLASRVALLGRRIERDALHHYRGRVFATGASLVLRLPVYDTQCGAKFFRRSAALVAALEEPFLARWVFDVELLGRLLTGAPGVPPLRADEIAEEPLRCWRDVPGSKAGVRDLARSFGNLFRIERDLARRRARVRLAG
jgi:glycosyltransferase involved in cell wall biosynthesis